MTKRKSKKYYIDHDEVYPVHCLIEPSDELSDYFKSSRKLVSIPSDKYTWIRRVTSEFWKVQDYLDKKCK